MVLCSSDDSCLSPFMITVLMILFVALQRLKSQGHRCYRSVTITYVITYIFYSNKHSVEQYKLFTYHYTHLHVSVVFTMLFERNTQEVKKNI